VSEVITGPGQSAYESGRLAFNLAADQRPDYLAMPRNERDVVSAVQFAVERGLRIAPQRTGHSATTYRTLKDAVLLRTDCLKQVAIDRSEKTARVQAGARWADVVPAASELGLAALHGASASVGIVGYTLSGGLSWYARKYGLAANHVRAAEIVTADGKLRRVDALEEPELFWALRGGGGGLGVVMALEFELLELAEVYAGALFFPWERSSEVFHEWKLWVSSIPDEATSVVRVLRFPPLSQIPEAFRGKSFAVIEAVLLGSEASATQLLQPLRLLAPAIDTFASVAPVGISDLHMDPQEPVPLAADHQLLRDIPDEAIDQLVRLIGSSSGSPLLSFEIRHLGGALSRQDVAHGALDFVHGAYLTFGVGLASTPDVARTVHEHLDVIRGALDAYDTGYALPGFTLRPADPALFYDPDTVTRLQDLRGNVDPSGLFVADGARSG